MSVRRRWPTVRTMTEAVTIDYTHKKQTGGSGQFARVKIEFEPREAGSGFEFESGVVGGRFRGSSFRALRRVSILPATLAALPDSRLSISRQPW